MYLSILFDHCNCNVDNRVHQPPAIGAGNRLVIYRIKLIGRLTACNYFIPALLILYKSLELYSQFYNNTGGHCMVHSNAIAINGVTIYCVFKNKIYIISL